MRDGGLSDGVGPGSVLGATPKCQGGSHPMFHRVGRPSTCGVRIAHELLEGLTIVSAVLGEHGGAVVVRAASGQQHQVREPFQITDSRGLAPMQGVLPRNFPDTVSEA